MYKNLKTFDSFDFDNGELWDYIADYLEVHNGAYYPWFVGNPANDENKQHKKLNEWLLQNGAEVGEKVLIEFDW